jgi:hypothetical protein
VRPWLRILLIVFAGLLVLAVVAVVVAYYATQHVPDFYREALEIEPAAQAREADAMERQVATAQNSTWREGR